MEYASINEVKIAFDLRGAGTPVMMIHGAQGDQTMFNELATAFSHDYQVLTFDQRGSGLSGKPNSEYTIAQLADDTAALMNHVGFERAHIIGVSMGGMIALEFALRHQARVRALVLGCTTPGGPKAVRIGGTAFNDAYSTRSMSSEERGRALAEAAFTKGYIARHPEIIPAMIESRRQRPLDPTVLGWRLKAAMKHDVFDRLSGIVSPTLVITGKDDALISWENSRILGEQIPHAKLVLLEPAGHCFWLEKPEESRAAIQEFLAAH
jgi:pimeloyl-ACP methyl ester carboxylesterase